MATLFGGGDGSSPTGAADSAAGAAEVQAAPSTLVATGSEYTTTDRAVFDEQVRKPSPSPRTTPRATLGRHRGRRRCPGRRRLGRCSRGRDGGERPRTDEASADASALAAPADARAAAGSSPLADPQALADCVEEVTEGTSATAAAVDLAVVDGLESTLLVVPDAAGLTYQVYVVGADCGDIDTRFDFFTVTP